MTSHPTSERTRPRWMLWLRWIIGIATAVGGIGAALLVTAIGHCSAFGGTCPADPQPLLHNDVFGSVAVIATVTVWVLVLCIRPDRRGAAAGLLAGVPVGLVVGLAAAAIAAG